MTQKRYVMRHGDFDTSDRYSGSKVMAQIVVSVFSVTLTLTFDLFLLFVTRTAHDVLNIHAKFH